MSTESSVSPTIIVNWILPLLLYAATKKEEWAFYKPLGYILIAVFLLNCLMSYYERLSFSYILNYNAPWVGKLYKETASIGESYYQDILLFRPMALFGHPLTNVNLMSFMTFSVYFSNYFTKSIRFIFLMMGVLALVSFNSRGALIIFLVLLLILSISYLFDRKAPIFPKILLCLFFTYFIGWIINNFEIIGGRFVASTLDDDSSQVRLDAINYFFSLSFEELLLGGVKLKYGENGVLMLIEESGLIFGSLFVFLHIFFSWIILKYCNSIAKILIFSGFFIVSCSNNNLSNPLVFSIYLLFIMCVNNSNVPFKYLKKC